MGQRGPAPDLAFPESEWFARNAEMLKRIEPERRESYLSGVRLVRPEAEKPLRAVLRKDK
jgi:hypothetical protein